MTDRTTPYDDTCTVHERIDEIVRGNVHIEMMDEDYAYLRIGDEALAIEAEDGKLVIRLLPSDLHPRPDQD